MWVHLFQRAQLFWTLGRSMTKGFFLSSKSQEHFDKWFPEVLVFSCSQTIIFPLKNESRQNCYLRTTMLMPLSFDWTETHELTIFCVNAKQKHQKVVPYVSLNRRETFSDNRGKIFLIYRSVKFKMNLWGHRFSQNANLESQGFLPYQTNKDHSQNC